MLTSKAIAACARTLLRRVGDVDIAELGHLSLATVVALIMAAIAVPASALEIGQMPSESVTDASAGVPVELRSTSSGCGTQPAHTGLFSLHTTDGKHRTRNFLVQLPPTYERSRAYPLILVFHGAGGNSSESYSWGLQNVGASSSKGSADNAIFVFPDGIGFEHYGVGWDNAKNGYDMPFFDNMLKSMEGEFCVNSKRVFVAGFSWGGDFVTALTCARGAVIRAAAANSSTDAYSNVNNYATYHNLPCPTTTHPAVRFGHASGGDWAYPAPRFATTSGLFRHLNSCSSSFTGVHSSTNVMSCRSYNNCSQEYVECAFNANLGHRLPPNWASDTWAFFATFT